MDSLPRFPPMPALPPNPNPRRRAAGHRRAHSETLLTLPDDILLDSDPNFSIADIEFPSLSDDSASASAPVSAPASAPIPANSAGSGGGHGRSVSVDAAFFEGLAPQGPPVTVKQEAKPLVQHGSSMDGLMSPPEGESKPPVSDFVRTAMPASKLAELELVDPKRAKRILANRQSAARSKERKIRYTNELERKVQTLQAEATTLSAQLTLLQRDTTGLTAENRELKLRLQAMEQQAQLREALNERLKEEVQRLKLVTGELPNANGNAFNRGLHQSASPFFTHPQQSHNLSGHQAQQIHSLQPSSNGSSRGNQSFHDSMEFM